MNNTFIFKIILFLLLVPASFPEKVFTEGSADPLIRYGGNYAVLSVAQVTDHTFEIILSPLSSVTAAKPSELPESEILAGYTAKQVWEGRSVMDPIRGRLGSYIVEILRSPLRVIFRDENGNILQQVSWPDSDNGEMQFLTEGLVFGFDDGESCLDRRGEVLPARFRPEAEEGVAAGAGLPAPVLMGADGWAIFVHHPLSSENLFDLTGGKGRFYPNPEMLDTPVQLFVTLWNEPKQIISEYKLFTGNFTKLLFKAIEICRQERQ